MLAIFLMLRYTEYSSNKEQTKYWFSHLRDDRKVVIMNRTMLVKNLEFDAVTTRGGVCPFCKRMVFRGLKYSTPSQGVNYAHLGCLRTHIGVCEGRSSKNANTNTDALRCINHSVEVTVYEMHSLYLASLGWEVIGRSGECNRFVTMRSGEVTSAHSTGKVVKNLINHGYKVIVNNKVVRTFEEYKALTDEGWC